MSEQIQDVQQGRNEQARRAALAAMVQLATEPTGLVQYHSRGRVLVIGDMRALEIAPRLSGALQPQVLLTEGAEEPGVPLVHLAGREMQISGHLGQFDVQLGQPGTARHQQLQADLILDLSPEPRLDRALPPPGYLHCVDEEQALQAAIDELQELVGTFEKPAYLKHDPDICAHARSGHTACRQCIDACPAQALSSLAEQIEIDFNLCQGGGACATACPSGAMQYAYPTAADLQQRIQRLLQTYQQQGGQDPVLVLHGPLPDDSSVAVRSNYLSLELEELASAGIETWLGALAYGARRVLLLDDGSLADSVREVLATQLATAEAILQGMGYPQDVVALRDITGLLGESEPPMLPEQAAASFYPLPDKRENAFMAIDHLYQQSGARRPMAALPTGAPFGMAQVDDKRCTLCMSCVSACPGKALQHGKGEPQLRFIEANCLQCGMCTRTCPEDAIFITPRLLFNRQQRNDSRLLHEEEPFNCTVCGKPFATRSVIERMQSRLQGHWMFQNERARNRLTMCEDCRAVDAIQDNEAMQASVIDPIRQ